MSARSVVEMAAMAPAASARRYYHGTKTQAAADKILADGVLREPADTDAALGAKGAFMRPVAGVYLTPELHYAMIYALGGDYAGSAPYGKSAEAEPYGYLFTVDGSTLTDAEPDEDVVGMLLYQIGLGDPSQDFFANPDLDKHSGHPTLLRELRKDPTLMRRLQRHFNQDTTPGVRHRAALGNYAWAVKAGKQLLRAMPPDLRAKLVELGSHLSARQREVPWAEAWRIKKTDAPSLRSDGSNFFEVAERVASKETEKVRQVVEAALPGASRVTSAGVASAGYEAGHYRLEGRKYWIAPDGEAHRCDDHSDWAAAQFDLPDDQDDGEKVGENIAHAQGLGWADVHTEQDSGTRQQFVYVRVPWRRLAKAQRESVKAIAERLAAIVVDDAGPRPVEVYDASGLKTD